MDPPLLYAALVTGAAAFACGLFTQSLREFTRGRLDELCAARGTPERFGEVLKNREPVLVVSRAASFVLNLACLLLAAGGLGLPMPGASPDSAWARWEPWAGWAAFTAVAVLVFSVLPWALARVARESLLARAWPLAAALTVPAAPLVAVANWVDRTLHRLAGRSDPDRADAAVLGGELMSVVDEGEREGLLEVDAGRMIRQVIELHDEDVAAVMTPRTEMRTIPAAATLEEARVLFLDGGHSRLPVCGDDIDDVRGVLYAKDLLRALGDRGAAAAETLTVEQIARPAVFVPDTTRLDTLLSRMKREQTHLAMVVDEYGGVAGLVTLEDLLEEIVGEIVDEHDPDDEADSGIEAIELTPGDAAGGTGPRRAYVVASWVRTDDFNEFSGLTLPEDGDFDTVGGFVFAELAHVPAPDETFHWHGLRVTVLDADHRKVNKVLVEPAPVSAA